MENSQNSSFLKAERRNTDASLTVERDKTNESLINSRKNTELQTDKTVQDERNKADRITSDARLAADSGNRDSQECEPTEEQKINEERLRDERKRADDAVELERFKVDGAIDHEREIKRALNGRVLEKERMMTDRNLSAERTRTDSEVQRTSGLLNSEISEHKKTKINLTTRDEFLAIVSHDLRNPIGTASMCAEMLLIDPAFKNLDTKVIKSIELIKRNIDTSLRLISDLLDMERIEEGKLQLKLDKHCISKILSESVESFAYAAKKKDVALTAVPTVTSNDVTCDRDRIIQVLSNLIGNALKFTPAGGSITIDTLVSETEVQVSICDSGPGIPEDKKEQIFTRFAQLGQNHRMGLGLGLYISKMLVEEHQGKLWLQSELGNGSTFYFTIPRQKPNFS